MLLSKVTYKWGYNNAATQKENWSGSVRGDRGDSVEINREKIEKGDREIQGKC